MKFSLICAVIILFPGVNRFASLCSTGQLRQVLEELAHRADQQTASEESV
jgi:hypothetical protein